MNHSKKQISDSEFHSIVALLHGSDQPGLVAKVSNWIWKRQGNILHADQHRDSEHEIFFQRVEWVPQETSAREIKAFEDFAEGLGMNCQISVSSHRPKVALFVSRYDHCYHDIILRWKAGEFNGELAVVISNHEDLRDSTLNYGLPFEHVPVAKENKKAAESRQIEILKAHQVELVILARYMQVLSRELLFEMRGQVINVHHSFLPAFAGAKPYHQAHQRGVKLIGATAHYATEDLDEGPIISQEVAPVNHRHSVADLVRNGRDLEKRVLAQAVRFHLEHRILCYQNKTVVFS